MRTKLVLLVVTLALAAAGCIGLGDDLDPTRTDASDALDQTAHPLAFEGTVAADDSQTHELDVTEETVRLNATLSEADSLALTVHDPEGTPVASANPGQTAHVLGVHLDEHGPGTYELTVTNSAMTGEASYSITGNHVTGEIPDPPELAPVPDEEPTEPGVTVALIDTGLNVYHETFQRDAQGAPHAIDQAAGEPARTVPLTHHQDKQQALIEDDATWRALEYQTLYKFEGTNAYGISFVPEDASSHYRPVVDDAFHGTATADRVLHEEPNATVIMVEVTATSWQEIADAIAWTAQQDWIDITTMSMGNPANMPNPAVAGGDPDNAVPQAAHKLVKNGGVFLTSAGNDPSLAWTDNAGGPPWMITVSGAEPTMKGQNIVPANGPDFVANFTAHAASDQGTDTYTWAAGTSFSSPHLAGTMANTLLQVREHANATVTNQPGPLVDTPEATVTTHDLRDAYNRTAIYWDATEYDPTNPPDDEPGTAALAASAPVTPAPWTQKGWGYANATLAQDAAEHLLGLNELDEKPAPAQAHMQAQHDARTTYWDTKMGS